MAKGEKVKATLRIQLPEDGEEITGVRFVMGADGYAVFRVEGEAKEAQEVQDEKSDEGSKE